MKSSRKEALEAQERYYHTGKPCKHGHFSKRITRTGECHECANEYQRKEREKYKNIAWINPDK